MSFFIQALFIVIPIFFILIIAEEIASRIMGIKVNRSADMISSLSSGITNTTKDAMKLSIVLISYSWFLERFTVYKLEPMWAAFLLPLSYKILQATGYTALTTELMFFGTAISFIIAAKSSIFLVPCDNLYLRQCTLELY